MQPRRAISLASSFLAHAAAVIVLLTSPETAVWGGFCDWCGGMSFERRQGHGIPDRIDFVLTPESKHACPNSAKVDREPRLVRGGQFTLISASEPSTPHLVPLPAVLCVQVRADGTVGGVRVLAHGSDLSSPRLPVFALRDLGFAPATAARGPVTFWYRLTVSPPPPPPPYSQRLTRNARASTSAIAASRPPVRPREGRMGGLPFNSGSAPGPDSSSHNEKNPGG